MIASSFTSLISAIFYILEVFLAFSLVAEQPQLSPEPQHPPVLVIDSQIAAKIPFFFFVSFIFFSFLSLRSFAAPLTFDFPSPQQTALAAVDGPKIPAQTASCHKYMLEFNRNLLSSFLLNSSCFVTPVRWEPVCCTVGDLNQAQHDRHFNQYPHDGGQHHWRGCAEKRDGDRH